MDLLVVVIIAVIALGLAIAVVATMLLSRRSKQEWGQRVKQQTRVVLRREQPQADSEAIEGEQVRPVSTPFAQIWDREAQPGSAYLAAEELAEEVPLPVEAVENTVEELTHRLKHFQAERSFGWGRHAEAESEKEPGFGAEAEAREPKRRTDSLQAKAVCVAAKKATESATPEPKTAFPPDAFPKKGASSSSESEKAQEVAALADEALEFLDEHDGLNYGAPRHIFGSVSSQESAEEQENL